MDPNALVLQFLDEAHATETALVTTLRAHIAMTTDGRYRRLLERHLKETQAQVENIDARRNARDEAATEALKIALYDALEAAARAAGDTTTAKLAVDHRKQEEKMLADLRTQIQRLAVATFEDKTDTKAAAAPSGPRSRSRSRSAAGSR